MEWRTYRFHEVLAANRLRNDGVRKPNFMSVFLSVGVDKGLDGLPGMLAMSHRRPIRAYDTPVLSHPPNPRRPQARGGRCPLAAEPCQPNQDSRLPAPDPPLPHKIVLDGIVLIFRESAVEDEGVGDVRIQELCLAAVAAGMEPARKGSGAPPPQPPLPSEAGSIYGRSAVSPPTGGDSFHSAGTAATLGRRCVCGARSSCSWVWAPDSTPTFQRTPALLPPIYC